METVAVRRDGMTGEEGARAASARRALAGLSLSMLLATLGISSANVALPALAQAFAAPFQQVQWVVLAYLLAMTALVVGVGRLGDRIGRRRLLLAGLALYTAASLLCGAAPALWPLVAARAVQGLAAAILMALAVACVGETVPKGAPKGGMGAAMGVIGTMSAVGTALGPSLGGLLIAGPGWRAIFFAGVPLGAAAFVLVWRHLPADPVQAPATVAGFDRTGTLLLALTLAAYALAMTGGPGAFAPVNAALLLAAVAGAGLFLRVEARAEAPLVRLSLLREPGMRAGLAMSALVSTVLMATLVVGPFYLAGALGLAPAAVGAVLSAGPVVAALTGVPAGRAVDRFGARRATLAGLTGVATGCGLLVAIPAAAGVPGYLAPIAVLTAGYALFQTANNTAVVAGARPEERGVVSGLLTLSRNLGLVTGASVMGAVFALASGAADVATAPPDAVAAGLRTTFAVACLLIAGAVALALGRRAQTPR